MKKFIIHHLSFIILFAGQIAGQSPVLLDHRFDEGNITPATFRDASSMLTIENINQPGFLNQFVPGTTPFFTFGEDPAAWWFYFTVKSKLTEPKKVILKLNRKNFDVFQLWQKDNEGAFWALPEVGANVEIPRKFWLLDCFYLEIIVQPGETVFFGRARNQIGSMHMGMTLHTPEHFEFENRQNLMVFGLFLGVLGLAVVFSIVLFLQYGDRVFLFYLLYIFNILLREAYNFSTDFGFWPIFQRYVVSLLLAASFGNFYRHFLRLWELNRDLDRLLFWYVRGVLAASGLILILAYFEQFLLLNALFRTINFTNLFFTMLALGVSIYYMKQSFRAFITLIAYSLLAIGFVLTLFRNLNLVGNYPFIQHVVMWGFIFEVVVFTIGFSVWYRNLDADKDNLETQLEQEELTRQLAIQAAEQRVKDRVARDLHDDISASVSGIRILSQVAKNQVAGILPGIQPLLDQIAESARSAGEAISDLIWAVKPGSDSLNDLADRIREYASKMLDAAGVDCHFQIPRDLPDITLDIETKRNLFLIFKETLNNSLKYSGCTAVSVGLNLSENGEEIDQSILKLEIHDNGHGFDISKISNGNGLPNMKKRANDVGASFEIVSGKGEGTSIICELPIPISQYPNISISSN